MNFNRGDMGIFNAFLTAAISPFSVFLER